MQTDRAGDDPQAVADALEMLEAFQKLRDPGVRRSVISLVHAMRPDDTSPHAASAPFQKVPPPCLHVRRSPWLYALLLLAAIAASAIAWEVFDPAPIGVAASPTGGRAR